MKAVSRAPPDHAYHVTLLINIGTLYQIPFDKAKDEASLDSALKSLHLAALCSSGNPYIIRFGAARKWVELSFMNKSSANLEAYHTAMPLVPELVWLGARINHRFKNVQDLDDLAVEVAAAAISSQKLEIALEWLQEA
ncbi:hypothetical protein B0J17DRAFT_724441 [Rhizoctonia solani]|nr:hypothetical protein B0J17DRAFT_724441 [Rhizoctonia solani]